MTNHETCLNEFRDASAQVRLAFATLSDAREVQIIANRAHTTANEAYKAAQARLEAADIALHEAADIALQAARAEPPAPADIDVTRMRGAGYFGNDMATVADTPFPGVVAATITNGAADEAF